MNPDPGPLASENPDQMIRFNLFCFLSGKKRAVPFVQKKLPKNSIQMVNAQGVGVTVGRLSSRFETHHLK